MSSKTPLYDRHVSLGGRVVDFAGWELAVQYEGVLAEHKQCRRSAVVFDTSHMGQFLIRGPDAAGQLNRAESRRGTNPGDEILWDGRPVGAVTSGAFSPSLEISIGMGYVRTTLAEPGRRLVVNIGRCELPVTISRKPLYRDGTCRTRNPL